MWGLGTLPTIHEHIPCSRRQGCRDAIQIPCQHYLAAQPTCVGQPKRHVKHVVLIVLRFW